MMAISYEPIRGVDVDEDGKRILRCGQYLLESCPENFICYLVSKEGSKDLNKIYEKRDDEKV